MTLLLPHGTIPGFPPASRADIRATSHACCGVVSNDGCDVSAPRGAVFKLSPAPPPPPKPAIACTSCEVESGATFVGGGGAGESLNTAPLGADTSQPSLLTTPQH